MTKNFFPYDLAATVKFFDEGLKEYLRLYQKLNVKVVNFQTLDDFEKSYLA